MFTLEVDTGPACRPAPDRSPSTMGSEHPSAAAHDALRRAPGAGVPPGSGSLERPAHRRGRPVATAVASSAIAQVKLLLLSGTEPDAGAGFGAVSLKYTVNTGSITPLRLIQ